MSEWQQVKLVDVCVDNGVQTGPFGSQLHQKDYVKVGTPIITVEHLGDNRITMQNLPRVSHEDKERLSKYALQEGDIVFSRVGSVDRRAYVRKEQDGWLFSGRCLRVRPDTQKIDPYYLSAYFGLPSFKEYVRSIAVGATMPSLNTTLLENVPIILPPKKQQELISHTAKSIEGKIDLNQRMNETLEAMARALFKSWFVDFDPVRAKAEGRKPEGMDAATAALFPAAFNDDGVPEGWEEGALGGFVEQVTVRTQPDSYTETIPYVPIECITAKSIFLEKAESGDNAKSSLILFKVGDILFGAMRPYFHKVCLAPFDGVTRTTAFVLRPRNAGERMFSLFRIFEEDTVLYATNHSEGSTIPYAKWAESLEKMPVIVPPSKIRMAFDVRVSEFIDMGNSNIAESRTLAALRDALLPKLISGELRIQDLRKQVKEVV